MDLLTCSAKDLHSYLLTNRFDNDEEKTNAFLLETIPLSSISALQKSVETINNVLSETKNKIRMESHLADELGDQEDHISTLEVQSRIAPRGKFMMNTHTKGLSLFREFPNPEKNIHLILLRENIRYLILFPKPDDCRQNKKIVSEMALFVLKEPIPILIGQYYDNDDEIQQKQSQQTPTISQPNQKKQKCVSQVCLQFQPTDQTHFLEYKNEFMKWKEDFNTNVFTCYLDNSSNENVDDDDDDDDDKELVPYFESENNQHPFVQCYHGINEGYLFPMMNGLLFFRPPLFISRDTIHSIGCGRGGTNSTRYVDMKIICNGEENTDESDDDETNQIHFEFTNIIREELSPLNKYIQKLINEEDSTDEDDDNDNENEKSDIHEKKRKAPIRNAAKLGLNATKYEMKSDESDKNDSMDEDFSDQDDIDNSSDDDIERVLNSNHDENFGHDDESIANSDDQNWEGSDETESDASNSENDKEKKKSHKRRKL